jgi:putative ABC transport system permease protein
MQHAKLGYNLDNMISVPLWPLGRSGTEREQAAIRDAEQIQPYSSQYHFGQVSVCENIPGFYIQNGFRVNRPVGDKEMQIISIAIDEHFLDVFEIQLLEGKGFEYQEHPSKPEKILITETARREFGLESATGTTFDLWDGHPVEIIGVVSDLHVHSLQNPIKPLMFRYGQMNNYPGFISMKYDSDRLVETIEFLSKQWKQLHAELPFAYLFPKEKYEDHYQEEKRIARLLTVFVFLTIIISTLGIFSMILHVAQKRTKEVGIRKVFGASIRSVLALLSREMLMLILVSFVLALIPGWIVMNQWLENFAYKTQVSWWIFGITGGVILMLCLLTIGYQTVKTARKNPVDTLRYE